jgi:hypothetical protein
MVLSTKDFLYEALLGGERAQLRNHEDTYHSKPPDSGFVRRKGPNIVNVCVCDAGRRALTMRCSEKTPADFLGVASMLAWGSSLLHQHSASYTAWTYDFTDTEKEQGKRSVGYNQALGTCYSLLAIHTYVRTLLLQHHELSTYAQRRYLPAHTAISSLRKPTLPP